MSGGGVTQSSKPNVLFRPKYYFLHPISDLTQFSPFLTHEYAKRNEWVIGDGGKFTHSLTGLLAYLLAPSLNCKLSDDVRCNALL